MKWLLVLALLFADAPAAAQPAPAASAAPRQLFLFLYRPGPAWRPGRPMREQDLGAHAAYHARLLAEGRSFAGGGYVGKDGGMAIIRASDMAEALAILAADPAIQSGVFIAEIHR